MILVTGATGLVGTHLLLKLTSDGKFVKAVYRSEEKKLQVKKTFSLFTTNADALWNKITWVQGDIKDVAFLHDAFKDVKHVYHCAALVSFDPKDDALLFKVNIEGTANVVNACLAGAIDKLIHVSSVAALGSFKEGVAVNETNEWKEDDKNSMYAISKYLGELEVWRGQEEGLTIAIVNPSVIIGECDWNSSSGVIFKNVANGLKFYPSGSFGFVDVQDVVAVMIKLMESEIVGEKYILNGTNSTYRELIDLIASNFNKPKPTIAATKFMMEVAWRMAIVVSKIKDTKPDLTRDTARSAMEHVMFDSNKIQKAISFSFQPITETVKRICRNYNRSIIS